MKSTHFKHYEILNTLGIGGFGEVFEAWDSKLRRRVALKRLKTEVFGGANSTPKENLLHEARMGAQLEHAAFVKVHAIEDDEDSQTIVMELVRGQTIKQMLHAGPLSVEQSLDIVLQIAQTMQAAHQQGLIHGDLKPSNLMLEPNGRVRILDFGLADQADPEATTSLMQADPQGTISYMAPERLMGKPASVQSDVYALGVILYELVNGIRPFAELGGLALAAAHMQSSVEQWPFAPEVSAALRALVWAMCASECGKRLVDMRLVAAQIGSLHPGSLTTKVDAPSAHARSAVEWVVAAKKTRTLPRFFLRYTFAVLTLVSMMVLAWNWMPRPLNQAAKPYSESYEMAAGLEEVRMWDRPGSLEKAISRFEEILKRSPKHAAAIAAMSLANSARYRTDEQDPILLNKAAASAQEALQINDQLALAHIAMAQVFDI